MKRKFFKVLAFLVLFTFAIGISAYALTEGYGSFAELAAAEDPANYKITANNAGSDTTILAIHGGGIERGTSELAEAIDGCGKYNTYLFEGLKPTENGSLYIKAINFDEPKAVNLVQNSDYTVSIIGAAGDDKVTYIGGQNKLLAEVIRLHLIAKGYNVKTLSIPDRIAGILNSNIVNKNKLFNDSLKLGGVQIAVSQGLRNDFVNNPWVLKDYSNSINNALSDSWPTIVKLIKKIDKSEGKSAGLWDKLNPAKPSLDKKVNKILEKGAKSPQELVENAKEVSEE